jgi:hypothetical protein
MTDKPEPTEDVVDDLLCEMANNDPSYQPVTMARFWRIMELAKEIAKAAEQRGAERMLEQAAKVVDVAGTENERVCASVEASPDAEWHPGAKSSVVATHGHIGQSLKEVAKDIRALSAKNSDSRYTAGAGKELLERLEIAEKGESFADKELGRLDLMIQRLRAVLEASKTALIVREQERTDVVLNLINKALASGAAGMSKNEP